MNFTPIVSLTQIRHDRRVAFKAAREKVRTYVNAFIQQCPLRLFDLQEMKMVPRSSMKDHIIGNTYLDHDMDATLSAPLGIEGYLQERARYAILSHRWSDNEVLLSDVLHSEGPLMVPGKHEAQDKLYGFFTAARAEGCRFVWFDTGCIDKSNGPEVDESIRSMFTWYRNAYVCIVHLRDTCRMHDLSDDDWCRRGWTLQELLAPLRLQFFGPGWTRLTGKEWRYDIDRVKRMCHPEIQGEMEWAFGTASLDLSQTIEPGPEHAPRMFSYASRRTTTRPEDIAYSLLSLLNIHIPIVYGEGAERAFYRLQVACLQETTSRSLFQCSHWNASPNRWNSLLAQSPCWFPQEHISFDIFDLSSPVDISSTFNNNGIRIMMYIFDLTCPPISSTFHAETVIGYSQLTYSILGAREDTKISLSNRWLDQAALDTFHREAVLAIYGWVGEVSYAMFLKRGNSASRAGYSRFEFSQRVSTRWDELPSATAIKESGIQPQWIYVK